MNAVSATTNFDPGILAALAPAAAAATTSAQTEFGSGFVNLISALLTPAEAPLPEAAPDTLHASQGNSRDTRPGSVKVRSSSEIADALIRSMLGSSLPAGNLFTEPRSTSAQTGNAKHRLLADDSQRAGAPAVVVPPSLLPVARAAAPVAPAPNPPAAISPAAPAPIAPGGAPGFGPHLVFGGDPKPAAAQASLAFALRLTPFETPHGNAPEAPAAPAPIIAQAGTATPALPAQINPAPVIPARIMPAPDVPAATMPVTPAAAAPAVPAPVAIPQIMPTLVPVQERDLPPAAAQQQQSPGKDNGRSETPRTALAEIKSRPESSQRVEAAPVVTAAAAASGHSGDFTRPLPNPLPFAAGPHNGEPAPPEPVRTAEQALRSLDVAAPAPAAAKGPTVQEIAVRLTGPEASTVDLHLTERAGKVHVSVRTPDAGLQSSLRQDLGTLVDSLERSGYRTEAFTAREIGPLAGLGAQMDARGAGQNAGQNGRDGASQDGSSNGRSSPDRSGPDTSGQDRSGQGGSHDSRGGHQRERRQQHNWIDTLEKTQ